MPISSSGHLILAGKFLGLPEMPLEFELVTHLATLAAVLIALRKTVFALMKRPFQKITALLFAATVPTVVVFFIFRSFFKSAFDGQFLLYAFGVTSVLLFITELVKYKNPKPLPGFLDAVIIGLAQGLAGMPGISRSGATLAAARLTGVEQKKSAEFSFLLSVPIILGSCLWEIISGGFAFDLSAGVLLVGFVSAFISGMICVSFMLRFIASRSMNGFAVYLMLLTIFLAVDKLILHLF